MMNRLKSIAFALVLLLPAPVLAEAKIGDLEKQLKTVKIDAVSNLQPYDLAGEGSRTMMRDLKITAADGTVVDLKKGESLVILDKYLGYYRVIAGGTVVYVNGNFTGAATAPPATATTAKPPATPAPPTTPATPPPATPAPPEKVIATGAVRVDTDLNVRTGPWGEIIGSLYDGNRVEVLAKEGDWLKIKFNGRIAYVHGDYVKLDGQTGVPVKPVAGGEKGVVTASSLNVRSAPWGTIIGGLNQGTAVTIKRRQGEWCVIDYNGQEAFVHGDYVGKPGAVPPADTTAPPPVAGPGGFTFPVLQFCGFSTRSFACHGKSGPYNQGVDIFGVIGRPLVACKAGKIRISVNSLGGNALHVVAGDEDFYYAHMNKYGAVSTGQSVPAGYRVGDLGETGNAAGKNAPHLHFAMVTGGGSTVVDPTQLLVGSKHGEVQVSN